MNKKCKFLSIFFICLFGICLFCFFFPLWYIDPFKLFHKPFLCKEQFYEEMRYNAKYIIDTIEFDNLILGSSNMLNTSSKQAGELFGGKFINISILGSNFKQRKILLDYVLTRKEPKIIISTIDAYILADLALLNTSAKGWGEIYDQNIKNDFSVYLNTKFLTKIYKDFFINIFSSPNCIKSQNLDNAALGIEINSSGLEIFSKQAKLIEQVKSALIPQPINITQKEIQEIKTNINEYLLSPAKKLKNTKFILLIPPYFVALNAINAQSQKSFDVQQEIIKYILENKSENISVYSFDDMDFTTNAKNYTDLGHYTKQIDKKILALIAQNKGKLTKENFVDLSHKNKEKALNFNLTKFLQEILEFPKF